MNSFSGEPDSSNTSNELPFSPLSELALVALSHVKFRYAKLDFTRGFLITSDELALQLTWLHLLIPTSGHRIDH